jgi:hypothetical protein
MEASSPDAGMAHSPRSESSMISSLAAYEPTGAYFGHDDSDDALQLEVDDLTVTELPAELTTYLSGDATPRAANNSNNNNGAPVPQFPQFDPRALLNPKSQAAKRPASSGGEVDRGRTDPTIAGQVALVERLHNVQERTASPAKRVKTDEDRKKATNMASFGGGSALDLQSARERPSVQQGPAIDLTMSKCLNTSFRSDSDWV